MIEKYKIVDAVEEYNLPENTAVVDFINNNPILFVSMLAGFLIAYIAFIVAYYKIGFNKTVFRTVLLVTPVVFSMLNNYVQSVNDEILEKRPAAFEDHKEEIIATMNNFFKKNGYDDNYIKEMCSHEKVKDSILCGGDDYLLGVSSYQENGDLIIEMKIKE